MNSYVIHCTTDEGGSDLEHHFQAASAHMAVEYAKAKVAAIGLPDKYYYGLFDKTSGIICNLELERIISVKRRPA